MSESGLGCCMGVRWVLHLLDSRQLYFKCPNNRDKKSLQIALARPQRAQSPRHYVGRSTPLS
jgi:hypothetical protein